MIPIPDRMRHLKVDARGYPIPWGVFIDADGLPHFAVNTEEIRHRCLRDAEGSEIAAWAIENFVEPA